MRFLNALNFLKAPAPATPAAGTVVVYFKADGLAYYKGEDGVEHAFSSGGGGSGATSSDLAFAAAHG